MTYSRHLELGEFLRSRREALSPAELGLATGPRRRTRGLRREEVALAAFLSTTWYTHLEQGRPVKPSVEVLESLADALRLDATERRYLHALASGPDRPALTPSCRARADVEALVASTEGSGVPIYAVDGHGDLVAWNRAADDWYGGFVGASDGTSRGAANICRWSVAAPSARDILVDWHREVDELAGRLRFFAASIGSDRAGEALTEELRVASADFRASWDAHRVSDTPPTRRRLRRDGGVADFHLVVLRHSVDPAVAILMHLDGDGPVPG